MEKWTVKFQRWFLPNIFTLFNLFFGCVSIFYSLERNYHSAAWFIIFAILCDGMDGKVARWQGFETQFGIEMDSLSDLVSSGLAPAVLVFNFRMSELGIIGILICFIYVLAGTYRLARFNVMQSREHSNEYVGLPIPVAGMTVTSYYFFSCYDDFFSKIEPWTFVLIILTFLMATTIPYRWPHFVFGKNIKKNLISSGILILLTAMAIAPYKVLFLVLILYILHGVFRYIVSNNIEK